MYLLLATVLLIGGGVAATWGLAAGMADNPQASAAGGRYFLGGIVAMLLALAIFGWRVALWLIG